MILIYNYFLALTTIEAQYTQSYSGLLTANSPTYTRNGGSGTFYYQALEVHVSTTGTYTFQSSSSIGDTFGYLYQGNFYTSYPQYNIVRQDDDGAGGGQFQLIADLRPDLTYILVFTSFNVIQTGSFDIAASGPGTISMTPININTL